MPIRLLAVTGAATVVAIASGISASPHAAPPAAADTTTTSADWLALLPDGAAKRQFIIDCTNCHQVDERHTLPKGTARTEAEWTTAIGRMLGYAGVNTGFPVVSAGRDAAGTARWLVQCLQDRRPAPSPQRVATANAEIREFRFPTPGDLPHDVAVDAQGEVIVTGMMSHVMQVLDPARGTWQEVAIPVERANPRAVEIDRNGAWWVVLGNPNMLARYDGVAWDTWDVGMYAHSVALDSNGGAWVNGHFTRQPELLASVDARGVVQHELPGHPTMAGTPGGPIPYELRTGPDGTIWMSELQGNRVIAYTPSTGASRVFTMPTPVSGPRRLDVDRNGIVWIPGYASGTLIRLDPSKPAGQQFEEIPLPIPASAPYIARVHPGTGTVWIGTGTADAVFAYHPDTRRFDTYPLPSRGAMVRHMAFDPRNGDVWLAYGESPGKEPARIARLTVKGEG